MSTTRHDGGVRVRSLLHLFKPLSDAGIEQPVGPNPYSTFYIKAELHRLELTEYLDCHPEYPPRFKTLEC